MPSFSEIPDPTPFSDEALGATTPTHTELIKMIIDAGVAVESGAVTGLGFQPVDADLTAISALSTTSFGRGLLALANAAAVRTSLALGTAAQSATTDFAPSTTLASAEVYTDLQIAAIPTDDLSVALAANAAACRTALALVPGTNVQAYDVELAALAGLVSLADRLAYFTGSGTAALTTFTAAGRALIDDADAATQRTTLGLGAGAVLGASSILRFVVDAGTSVIATGPKTVYATVPWNATITSWNIFSTVSGSAVFDIWKTTYANYAPPTHPAVADTITASAKPTLTSATKATSSTLTGWTTTLTAGQILEINVDSVTSCTKLILELLVTKTS